MSTIAFTACEFIYDNINGNKWGLNVVSMSTGEYSGANIKTEVNKIQMPRRAKFYNYGKTQSEPLTFQLKIMKLDNLPLDRFEVDEITAWLTYPNKNKRLFLLQKDLYDTYYNCDITQINNVEIGNQIFGLTLTCECDSPYAWQCEKVYNFGSITSPTIFNFNNRSADFNGLFPTFTFQTSIVGNSFYIKNITNNNNTMSFTGLNANETITIDCDRQIITSSTGVRRAETFNGTFMRLLRGSNQLEIGGNLTIARMTYQFAKQVGE